MSKYNSNVPINRDLKDNQTDNSPEEKKTQHFSEFFQISNEVKEVIDIMDRGIIKSVISEKSNMGLKPESTVKNYNKVENIWNCCSDDTGTFPKMNKMKKNYISSASGAQLVTSLNFSVPGC